MHPPILSIWVKVSASTIPDKLGRSSSTPCPTEIGQVNKKIERECVCVIKSHNTGLLKNSNLLQNEQLTYVHPNHPFKLSSLVWWMPKLSLHHWKYWPLDHWWKYFKKAIKSCVQSNGKYHPGWSKTSYSDALTKWTTNGRFGSPRSSPCLWELVPFGCYYSHQNFTQETNQPR